MMNRFKYLELLSSMISKELPNDEYNSAMQYYTEYFQDAGPENEAQVMEELGSPEKLAQKIIAEYKGKSVEELNAEKKVKKTSKIPVWLIVLIAVVGSPIWISIFSVAVSILITYFAVVLSLGVVALCCILAGICVIGVGILAFAQSPAVGIFVIGLAFVSAAVGIGFLMLTFLMIKFVIWVCNKIATKKRRAV